MGDERRDGGDNHGAEGSQPPLSPTRAFAVLAMIALVGGSDRGFCDVEPGRGCPRRHATVSAADAGSSSVVLRFSRRGALWRRSAAEGAASRKERSEARVA